MSSVNPGNPARRGEGSVKVQPKARESPLPNSVNSFITNSSPSNHPDLSIEDDLEDILLSMFTVTIMLRRHRISNVLKKILPSLNLQTTEEELSTSTSQRYQVPDPGGSSSSNQEGSAGPSDHLSCDFSEEDNEEEVVDQDDTDTKETSLIVEGSSDDEEEEAEELDKESSTSDKDHKVSHKSNSPDHSEGDIFIEEGVRNLLCEVIFEESVEELQLEEEEEAKGELDEEDDDIEEDDDMDWMYFNPEAATFSSLGCYVGQKYKVADNARETLARMTRKLKEEDPTLRTFRRALGFSQVIQKELAPILLQSKDDRKTFTAAIRFLNNYLTPVECLLSLDDLAKTEEGQQTVFELNQHLSEAKNVFLDQQITKNILDFMKKELQKIHEVTEKSASDEDTSIVSQRSINDCLTLLRNVLHIPDETPSGSSSPSSTSSNQKTSRQNQILWNLFSANLDTVVMKIIGHKELKNWCTTLTQVIALIYKDQHVYNLQRLLAQWLETEISESSEDNESNTSPQDQNGSCSSPVLTSAETDDSSDGTTNGGHGNSDKEGSCPADASSFTDSGHETKLDSNSAKSPQSTKYSDEDTLATTSRKSKTGGSGTGHASTRKDAQEQEAMECSFSEGSSEKGPPCKKTARSSQEVNRDSSKCNHHDSNARSNDMCAPHACVGAINHKRKASTHLTSSDESSESSRGKCREKMYKNGGGVQQSKKKSQKISEIDKQDHKCKKCKSCKDHAKPVEMGDSGNSSGNNCCLKSKSNGKDPSSSSAESNSEKQHQSPLCSIRSEGMSDYGYVSQRNMATQENGSSTSSNDDDQERKRKVKPHTNLQKPRPQKPNFSPAEKRELRRQKLINRAKSERMKVKSLVHHIPTEDDVADLLKEFTVDFLLKGYSSLVDELRKQLLNDFNAQMDKSHFLWLVTYFLKFASQLEVGMEVIGLVLSVPTISYLTHEGVRFYEELELACRMKTIDLRPHLRRMHLVVTAIQEFIQTLETYSNFTHFSHEDQIACSKLQRCCLMVKELRQLFVLLIRRYNPNVQSIQYLHDLISANHTLLIMLERVNVDESFMTTHLQQFASVEVMRHYGLLLENFYTNSDGINDAIFTMMHHISGDLNAPEALYVPQILKSFSDIWEQEIDICEDWSDLIEYVIQKFITTMGTKPHACASNLLDSLDPNSDALDDNGFSKNQLDNLYWYFSQCESTEDPVGGIIDMYKATYSVTKTRVSVIQALLSHGIITHAQYMSLMYMKSILSCKPYHEGSVVAEAGSEHSDSERHDVDIGENSDHDNKGHSNDQVDVLKELLKKQGKGYLLQWLQSVLLDVCRVKLSSNEEVATSDEVLEPVPFHFNHVKQSIPVVPWNKQQESGLQTETFIMLLHKLGFHLAADVGKSFPRIPHFWSAEHVLHLAQKLGPLQPEELTPEMSILLSISSENEKDETRECPSPKRRSTIAESNENKEEDVVMMDTSWSNASPSPNPLTLSRAPFSPLAESRTNSALPLFSTTPIKDPTDTFSLPTPTYSWLQMAMLSKSLHHNSSLAAASIASTSANANHGLTPMSPTSIRPRSAASTPKQVTVTTRSTFVVPSTGFSQFSSGPSWAGKASPNRPSMGCTSGLTTTNTVLASILNDSTNASLERMQISRSRSHSPWQ